MNRGDVVIIDYTRYDPGAYVRPALVVQNDRDNARLQKTIVAQITGNISRAYEDTQYLIDSSHPDWRQSGLQAPSVIVCSNLATIEKDDVGNRLGTLSGMTMQQIDECLKAALELL
jgi:mRNA interferase MazF